VAASDRCKCDEAVEFSLTMASQVALVRVPAKMPVMICTLEDDDDDDDDDDDHDDEASTCTCSVTLCRRGIGSVAPPVGAPG
jgi:hypothetical protein